MNDDDVCLECSEPVDVEGDVEVVGPDGMPIGYAHQECIDEAVLW